MNPPIDVDQDNELTGQIIGVAIDVHRELGPGNVEAAYEEALSLQLARRGIKHVCQMRMPVRYRGQLLDCGLRLDILVDDRLPVELKSHEHELPVHEAQLMTYMRMGRFPLGLLINFNVPVLKQGIHRKALTKVDDDINSDVSCENRRYDPLSVSILDSAMSVHRNVGPGLLASIYEECFCQELKQRGITFERQKSIPLLFGGQALRHSAEIPLVVANAAPVFCLSIRSLLPLHEAILRSRLRQGGYRFGFLLNFHPALLSAGVRRIQI